MGSKSESKKIMIEAGVPVIPGYFNDQNQSVEHLYEEGCKLEFPLILKGVSGGGGKGKQRCFAQFAVYCCCVFFILFCV